MKLRLLGTAFVLMFLASPFANAEVFNCAGGDVACLINAINTANGNGEDDTINLMAGTYTLTEVNNDTNGPNGLPSITSQITITNADANSTIIERDKSAPLFRIVHVAATGILRLDGITITGGEVDILPGGGILNKDGALTLVDSTVSNNRTSAFGANGGGISTSSDAVVSLVNSVISGNSGSAGGGINNFGDGRLTIIDSTISDNQARDQSGGGISSGSNFDGTFQMINSTVNSNTSPAQGGGIEVRGFTAMTMINSTVSGNEGSFGGGIRSVGPATLGIFNSTISENIAMSGGGGIRASRGAVTMTHTIVAGNIDVGGIGPDCLDEDGSTLTSLGQNLVGDRTGCPSDGVGDLTVNPDEIFTTVLGPLQNNGGPTDTYALLAGSSAIDAGKLVCTDPSDAPLTTDQRGKLRPVDGNGDGTTACDIGAFEFQVGELLVDIDIKPGNKDNVINPRAKGSIWVAVLSDADPKSPFDPPSQIDIPTVEFGPDGAKAIRHKVKDIDKDGLGDLLLRFKIPATGIACGDTKVTLTGKTFDGQSITGTDSIRTVGCKSKKHHDD